MMFLPLSVRLARRLDTLVQDFGAEVQITQDELAGLVGVTRESINRQLQEWRASGIVTLGRGRISVDRERLAVEARKACAGFSKAGAHVRKRQNMNHVGHMFSFGSRERTRATS
jgi:hypothetical protein